MSSATSTAVPGWRPPGLLSLPEPVWRTRHLWVTSVLLLHLPVLVAWTLLQDVPAFIVATLALPVALYLVAAAEQLTRGRVRVHRALASCAAAAGLMACSSYLVSISGGYIEAHFHFFVMVPVVALYEAWAPFSVAVGWVLVEHGVVGTLLPHHVYGSSHEHMAHPWRFALVHAGFFAAACLGSLTSWTLAERARAVQQGLVEQLSHRATHDDLTGLANRAHLAEAMDAALASGQQVAVLALDLDRFKEVNDTLGHSAGDELLRAVSSRATTVLADAGLLVRLGGDEFAVLLPGHDVQSAVCVATRLRTSVGRTVRLLDGTPGAVLGTAPDGAAGVSVSVDVSIGIAHRPSAFPADGSGPQDRAVQAEQLLREADVAMYSAKRSGSGSSVYDASSDEHTTGRLVELRDFRRALDVDDQIVVHLQPKVSISTGALVGAEALARWRHPTRGVLPPSEFIAMATSPDLAQRFSALVMRAALRQCRTWLDEGHEVPVSVNTTPQCLVRPTFAFEVIEALQQHGVPAHLLCLEITEDALITDPDAAAEVLGALRRAGVRCSIDDFGTGYSSLSYLRRLPLDELKIDRAFVLGLFPGGDHGNGHGVQDGDEPVADEVLVASIIDLGHRLGVHVVAEGVEHPRELEVLRRLGCDSVQGYIHCPPVPAERFPRDLLATALLAAPARTAPLPA